MIDELIKDIMTSDNDKGTNVNINKKINSKAYWRKLDGSMQYMVSPSSPRKTTFDIVPFKDMHQKTYFKTLENMIQNKFNKTSIQFSEHI